MATHMSYQDRKKAYSELPSKTVKIIRVGNSHAVTIPKEYLQFVKDSEIFDRDTNEVTWSPLGGGLSLHRDFRLSLDSHYEKDAETKEGAERAGLRAFIAFYNALGIAPGSEDEADIGEAWTYAFDSFKSSGFQYHIHHSCIDRDAGESDVDAQLRGCEGDEGCGYVLSPSRWSDDAWKAFIAASERCWPSGQKRNEMMYLQ